jgi:flagellar protein FliO/FliZ
MTVVAQLIARRVIRLSALRRAAPMRHLFLFLLCAVTVAAADPQALKNPDTVIYPHAATEKQVTVSDRDGWDRAPWLFGALALAAGGVWWFWRNRTRAGPGGQSGRKLAIEETRSLGNRQYLVIAAYDGKKLLLGVTPGRIKLLCDLSKDEVER